MRRRVGQNPHHTGCCSGSRLVLPGHWLTGAALGTPFIRWRAQGLIAGGTNDRGGGPTDIDLQLADLTGNVPRRNRGLLRGRLGGPSPPAIVVGNDGGRFDRVIPVNISHRSPAAPHRQSVTLIISDAGAIGPLVGTSASLVGGSRAGDHANASALAKHISGLMAASDCGMAAPVAPTGILRPAGQAMPQQRGLAAAPSAAVRSCCSDGTGTTARAQHCATGLTSEIQVADRESMIRASAAHYFWFSFPTILAEGGTRVV